MTAISARGGTGRRKPMTLGQHLVELRKRLFRSALGIVVGTVGGWFVSDYILQALRAPIVEIARQQHRLAELNYDSLTGAFDLKMQIAVTVGVIVSSPFWLYQVFAFLLPGLKRTEKRHTLGFFFAAVPLFLAGCWAGWLVVPHMVTLLTGFAPVQATSYIQAKDYFDFILKLVVAIGIAFVLPVVLVLLDFIGVLTAAAILKAWRFALVIIVVFTAIVTPSADVISMFLLAIPMVMLYFAAYGVSVLHDRRALEKNRTLELETQEGR